MYLLKNMLSIIFFCIMINTASADSFIIKDIKIKGLQNVNPEIVLSYISVKPGDVISDNNTGNIIRELYKEKLFSDIKLKRHGSILIIEVTEHPIIDTIEIIGDTKISKAILKADLKSMGIIFSEGVRFDPLILQKIKYYLLNKYNQMGYIHPDINIHILKSKIYNKIHIKITVNSGVMSKIKSIKFSGNNFVSDKQLLNELPLTATSFWDILTDTDKFSQEKLDFGLEKIKMYYWDRGFLEIKVIPKILFTNNSKEVVVKINIQEGPRYYLDKISVAGELLGKDMEINKLIKIKEGNIFSWKDIVDIQNNINIFFAEMGYGLSNVKIMDNTYNAQNHKKISIEYVVHPGNKIFIRNINFIGNSKTSNKILRRELNIHSGEIFKLSKIHESRSNIANLSYLQDVIYKIIPVKGMKDHVDLEYIFKENSSVALKLQGGYSDYGIHYGISIENQNLFNTGKLLILDMDKSHEMQNYKLSCIDRYFAQKKISLSNSIYLRKKNLNNLNNNEPNQNNVKLMYDYTYGVDSSFNIPINNMQYKIGAGIEHIDMESLSYHNNLHPDIDKFFREYGSLFTEFKITTSASYHNLNHLLFPTSGMNGILYGEMYIPINYISKLIFYKTAFDFNWYLPINKIFTLVTHANCGYLSSFDKQGGILFPKNFYLGGIGSIRGFGTDTINNDNNGEQKINFGGNFIALASLAMIIPVPEQINEIIRPEFFIDIGGLYNNTNFKADFLRISTGVQFKIRTPIAPLIFSINWPISKKPWDNTQIVQFGFSNGI